MMNDIMIMKLHIDICHNINILTDHIMEHTLELNIR